MLLPEDDGICKRFRTYNLRFSKSKYTQVVQVAEEKTVPYSEMDHQIDKQVLKEITV